MICTLNFISSASRTIHFSFQSSWLMASSPSAIPSEPLENTHSSDTHNNNIHRQIPLYVSCQIVFFSFPSPQGSEVQGQLAVTVFKAGWDSVFCSMVLQQWMIADQGLQWTCKRRVSKGQSKSFYSAIAHLQVFRLNCIKLKTHEDWCILMDIGLRQEVKWTDFFF